MAHPQTSAVVVQLTDDDTLVYEWATSVRVDRKGTLHVYGDHHQHLVHLEGEWTQYAATAPARPELEIINPEEYH